MKKLFILGMIISAGIVSLIMVSPVSFRQEVTDADILIEAPELKTTQTVSKKDVVSLQLSGIFDGKTDVINTEDVVYLRATGDIMPARSVNTQTKKKGDYTWAFQPTAEYLRSADITLINLETPLLEPCPLTDEGMIFCGALQHTEGLNFAGIDVVNIANNHTENFGSGGVEQTITALQQHNLGISGIGKPYILTVNGVRFGFLGYNDIVTGQNLVSVYDEDQVRQDLSALRTRVDVIVVSYHWGVEYTHQPSSRQRKIAHKTIDDGADVVIGNHPHWIQPVEVYKNRVIMYSHGNFIFDQMWSEETRIGVVGTYVFSGKELVDVTFDPIKIFEYGQPRLLESSEKDNVLEALRIQSERFAESTL